MFILSYGRLGLRHPRAVDMGRTIRSFIAVFAVTRRLAVGVLRHRHSSCVDAVRVDLVRKPYTRPRLGKPNLVRYALMALGLAKTRALQRSHEPH